VLPVGHKRRHRDGRSADLRLGRSRDRRRPDSESARPTPAVRAPRGRCSTWNMSVPVETRTGVRDPTPSPEIPRARRSVPGTARDRASGRVTRHGGTVRNTPGTLATDRLRARPAAGRPVEIGGHCALSPGAGRDGPPANRLGDARGVAGRDPWTRRWSADPAGAVLHPSGSGQRSDGWEGGPDAGAGSDALCNPCGAKTCDDGRAGGAAVGTGSSSAPEAASGIRRRDVPRGTGHPRCEGSAGQASARGSEAARPGCNAGLWA
jgi:hypothetical protein